ncbi:hypothetical protein jhhlp_004404 [Lomentospora prolificans]|uniref:Uncharacterized protein n=1 Tax=Lomentospora prolificans TaxID=41688 RepID=A0A2N3NBH4_9PEZI|nr:hypothetical protein jhhlp_004404 [Lomentospora prolificans]
MGRKIKKRNLSLTSATGADTPAFAVIEEQPIKARAPQPDGLDDPFNPFAKETLAQIPSEKPAGRKSFASSIRDFSSRNLPFLPQKPTRSHRLRISSPTNFRHVYSHSGQYSDHFSSTRLPPTFGIPRQEDEYQQQEDSYRPLQLVTTGVRLSPILPNFEPNDRVVTPPPAAKLRDDREDEIDGFNLKRSRSSLSFHVPRRRAMGGSSQSSTPLYGSPQMAERQRSASSPSPPEVPPKSRARAYTAPAADKVDTLKERIAEAMMERDRLQEMIDDVIERQSIYLGSRPSTAHSMRTQILASAESVPAIPALPPMAPSFAERLNPDLNRSATRLPGVPTQTFAPTPTRVVPHATATTFQFSELAPAPLHVVPFQAPPTPPRSRASDRPIQPPLPLVLRPPLRKKKSFSRVSTWLFPNAGQEHHQRGLSVDSITNVPRPVRNTEGFYQCVSPPGTSESRRLSTDSTTVTTWASEDEEETVPTTLSPCQSPAVMLAGAGLDGSSGLLAVPRGQEQPQRLDRMTTFGGRSGRSEVSNGSGISGASTATVVGVAY